MVTTRSGRCTEMASKEETTRTTETTPRPLILVEHLICKELVLPHLPMADAGTPGFYPRKPAPYISPASLLWGLGLWFSGQQN